MTAGRRLFLVDTDTASDDAVALLMALRHPDVDVLAITVVAGDVPLEQAVQNALYVVELAGADVPVHAGCDASLVGPLRTAQSVHGMDGMSDIGLPLAGRAPAAGHEVDVIVETVNAHPPGSVTLVAHGPLTNVATALRRDPGIAERLGRVVIMGRTGDAVGNMSAVAEFDVWADPEAAAIVLASGASITMVGWDISRTCAVFDPTEAAALRELGTHGILTVDIQATLEAFAAAETGLSGFDLADPIATAVAPEPAVATNVRFLIVVEETAGEHTTGRTVGDHLGITKRPPNDHVVPGAPRERSLPLLHAALRSSCSPSWSRT